MPRRRILLCMTSDLHQLRFLSSLDSLNSLISFERSTSAATFVNWESTYNAPTLLRTKIRLRLRFCKNSLHFVKFVCQISSTYASMSSGSLSNLSPQELAALSRTPTIPPPPGVEPSFLTPENNQHPLIIVSSLFLALSSVFVLNRAYTKTFIVRKHSWDDCELTHHLS